MITFLFFHLALPPFFGWGGHFLVFQSDRGQVKAVTVLSFSSFILPYVKIGKKEHPEFSGCPQRMHHAPHLF